jgi:hypothetical protein
MDENIVRKLFLQAVSAQYLKLLRILTTGYVPAGKGCAGRRFCARSVYEAPGTALTREMRRYYMGWINWGHAYF